MEISKTLRLSKDNLDELNTILGVTHFEYQDNNYVAYKNDKEAYIYLDSSFLDLRIFTENGTQSAYEGDTIFVIGDKKYLCFEMIEL
jgi:hypothetical protein